MQFQYLANLGDALQGQGVFLQGSSSRFEAISVSTEFDKILESFNGLDLYVLCLPFVT